MTGFSTILGTLPIALGLGASAESRVSMGIAVVGDLMLSSIPTLFVIPAMYSYLSKELGKTVQSRFDVTEYPEPFHVAEKESAASDR